jgi:hypothetical protein
LSVWFYRSRGNLQKGTNLNIDLTQILDLIRWE